MCVVHHVLFLIFIPFTVVESLSQRTLKDNTSIEQITTLLATSDPTAAAIELATFIQSLDVQHFWKKKEHVAWFSGVNNHASATFKTHCSAFMAAVSERAGVPLLRPPQHSQDLLATAQHKWLEGTGSTLGWTITDSPVIAQAAANAGILAVISKANPNPHSPGHAAVVIPNHAPSIDFLKLNGPQEAQAGSINSGNLTASKGFKPLHTENVFYAFYSRKRLTPRLMYTVWSEDGDKKNLSVLGKTRYLLDLAPAGRLDAIKLTFSSGLPVWYSSNSGLLNDDSNTTAPFSWYAYYRYDGLKGEPFDVKKKSGPSSFTIQDSDRIILNTPLSIALKFDNSTPVTDELTGLWYATIDANMLGIFITSSDESNMQGYWLAYNDDKKQDGVYHRFTASWVKNMNGTVARGKMELCGLVSDILSCRMTANSLEVSINGTTAAMNGLPGRRRAVFQKATVFTPILDFPVPADNI